MRGPCVRTCCATQRRCFGGRRRQTSQAVSATPTGPRRRVRRRGIGASCPDSAVLVVLAVSVPVSVAVAVAALVVVAARAVLLVLALVALRVARLLVVVDEDGRERGADRVHDGVDDGRGRGDCGRRRRGRCRRRQGGRSDAGRGRRRRGRGRGGRD